jgi:hypothetical protein
MSPYDELLAKAKGYRPGQAEADMRVLARDERFAAVVAWMQGNLEAFTEAACAQKLADSHGRQSHAAGSVYALRVMQGQLRTAVEPPRRTQPPVEEPEA